MATKVLRLDQYGVNGSAAYDLNRLPGTEAPALPRLPEQPQVAPKPQVVVQKGYVAISPFGFFGMAISACLLVLVLFAHVQLFEATTQVGQYESQISQLDSEYDLLKSQYAGLINLAYVEQVATTELGLSTPAPGQIVELNLSSGDRAEIVETVDENVISRFFHAIQTSFEGLITYLS